MREFVLCGLLLLAFSSVYVDSSTPASPSTEASTSSSSGGNTVPSTWTPKDSTDATENPPSVASGSTASPGPSNAPQTIPTGQTPEAPQSSTTAKTVTPPTTQTQTPGKTDIPTTTTPIPITVSKAQVTMTCTGGRCKYVLEVPRLTQAFLDQQWGNLATDQALYDHEESKYQNLTKTSDVQDIETQFQEINEKVQKAIELYNQIQQALKQIPIDSLSTNSSAVKIQTYISTLKSQTNTCLYLQCLQPPTTTTTTTTPPTTTTTPNPCQPDSCNCQTDCTAANGKPTCGTCNGNLDNGQMCVTSNCTSVGKSKAQPVTDYSWLVSPGYNIAAKNQTDNGYGPNLSCEWTLQFLENATLSLSVNAGTPFSTMDPNSKLSMKCGGFSYSISSSSSATKVNGALKACTVKTLTFTFTSGTVASNTSYFGVQFLTQDGAPTPPPCSLPPPSPSTTTSSP